MTPKLFDFIYGIHPHNNILTWNWLFTHKNNQWIQENKKLFREKRVIDYGCGKCPYFEYISDMVSEYVALDVIEHVNVPQHKKLLHITLDETGKIPNGVEPADIVLSNQVLVELHDVNFYLSEIRKTIKPGGFLFLTNPWGMPAIGHSDRIRFTPFHVVLLLKNAGFQIQQYTPSGYFFTTVALSLNLLLTAKNNYDIYTSEIKISKWKWVIFTPIVFLNNIVAVLLDKVIPLKRCPANYLIIAKKHTNE